MRIAHVSDIHVRNLKYHDEYKRVFDDLYCKLRALAPDIVVCTGDTGHGKTQISPEFVSLTSELYKNVSLLAPLILIPGNHDMNVMNPDRRDAISPIVESIGSDRIHFLRSSGLSRLYGINFWVFSLLDTQNFPVPSSWREHDRDINIGLFHGTVNGCVLDNNFDVHSTRHDIGMFDGLDFVMLGDVHKRQRLDDAGRIMYAGSLIQQNFGEEVDKGFLLWDIESKEKFDVSYVSLSGSRKFVTLKLDDDMNFPHDVSIDEGSHIRIVPSSQVTLSQQRDIEKRVKRAFKPHDVITLSHTSVVSRTTHDRPYERSRCVSLRDIGEQERLLREFFLTSDRNVSDDVLSKVLDINRRHHLQIEQGEDVARDVTWKINKIVWKNFFNYGEDNFIDFSCVGGLVGVFAPNASGKSNLIDIVLETCFDSTTKGVNKNIFLINDNKDTASSIAEITANGSDCVIERTIERIKYGQKKFDSAKEWGKTTVTFSSVDEHGCKEPIEGISRHDIEKNIRQKLGSFDDFMLTSLSAQWNQLDVINVKETKRKEILYRFLDLDIFEKKYALARDESKQYMKLLDELEDSGLESAVDSYKRDRDDVEREIASVESSIDEMSLEILKIDEKIVELVETKVPIALSTTIDTIEKKLESTRYDIKREELRLVELSSSMSSIDREIGQVDEFIAAFDLQMHEEKSERHRLISQSIVSMYDECSRRSSEIELRRSFAKKLDTVPCSGSFASCVFIRDSISSRDSLSTLDAELEELSKKLSSLVSERDELEPYRRALEAAKKHNDSLAYLTAKREKTALHIENACLKLDVLRKAESDILSEIELAKKVKDDIARNIEVDASVSALRSKRGLVSSSLSSRRAEHVSLSKKLGMCQGVLDKISSQLDRLRQTREYVAAYEHYMSAMGKDGIAYKILVSKLPVINEEINKILSNVADFNVFIEHDRDEQSMNIYLQYGQYKSRFLELGSGAEKFIASIAIRAALLNISSLPKTNMFIIDEGFGKLDPKNIENICSMLEYLKSMFEHVIIISHLDTLKDVVDDVIEITSDSFGYAHVEIGG